MSPFWVGLFENLKERGRNATLFLVALALFGAVLIAGGVLSEALKSSVVGDFVRFALVVIGVLVVAWSGRTLRRNFFAKRGPTDLSRLSSDELTKARSKLLKNQTRRL